MSKMNKTNQSEFRRKPLIMALESRILLDGAMVVTAAEALSDVDLQTDAVHGQSAEQSMHFAAPAPTNSEAPARREVAFVDTSVAGYESLLAELGTGVETILIDGSENGLEQMVAALQGLSNIDALHVLSHGSLGELRLGSLTLNADNLQDNAGLLSALGQSLSQDADLMLYGCNVGAEQQGRGFIDALAGMTGADVAASDDLTGAARLGGDWELEAESGVVETLALSLAGFDGVLAPTVSAVADSVTYTEGGEPVRIDTGITFTGGGDYREGYIRFTVENPTAGDKFVLQDAADVNAVGAISVQGNDVYLGKGVSRERIGSIDSVENGVDGKALKILLSTPLPNAGFEDGSAHWTLSSEIYGDGVGEINFDNYLIPLAVNWDSNSNYTGGTGSTNVQASNGFNPQASIRAGVGVKDTQALYLSSSGSITRGDQDPLGNFKQNGYGSIHGPYATSTVIKVENGDSISLDFRAVGSGDDYEVFGMLRQVDSAGNFLSDDVNNAANIILFAERGADTNGYVRVDYTGLTAGDYRFQFVGGTYDGSGGLVVGSNLYVDNIRLISSNVVNDTIGSQIASQVTYQSTADDTEAERDITISARDSAGGTGSDTITLIVEQRNNAPVFSDDGTLSPVNEDTLSPSGSTVGNLFDSLFDDPDTAFTPGDYLSGIIITADGSNPAQGQWQYTTDGSTWYALGEVATDNGLLLSHDASLRFVPVADFNDAPGSLSAHAVDSSDSSISFTSGADRKIFDTSAAGTGGNTAVSFAAVRLKTSITAVDDAPILEQLASISGGTEDSAKDITYAQLLAATGAQDVDGDAISFRIETINSGQLKKDTGSGFVDVVAGVTLIDPGESLLWLADEHANGPLGAFTVRAVDAQGALSANTSAVSVVVAAVNDLVTITGKSSATLLEDSSILINGFTLTDVEGDDVIVRISATNGTLTLGSAAGVTVAKSGGKELEFSGSLAAAEAALNTLRYAGDADYFGQDQLTITVSDDNRGSWQPYRVDEQGLFYNPLNGHYYEYISAPGITWDDAKAAAEQRELFGLKGYLATVTSQAENDFIAPKLGGDGWIGASDAYQEGIWRWVTGPEAGTQFWTGDTSAGTSATSNYGSSFNGGYANWAQSEPNNSDSSRGGEDVAHFYASGANAGKWNDFAANNLGIEGYVVEYGGTDFGDLQAAKLQITISPVNDAPTISADASAPITEAPGDSSAQDLSYSGVISFNDLDTTDVVSITFASKNDISWSGGTLTEAQKAALVGGFSIPATTGAAAPGSVSWTYSLNDMNLDFLAAGETLTFSYIITATDNQNATATDTVTFTITGSNDSPEIQIQAPLAFVEAGNAQSQTLDQSGLVRFNDLDTNDRVSVGFISNNDLAWRAADGSIVAGLPADLAGRLLAGFSVPQPTGIDAPGDLTWQYRADDLDLDFLAADNTISFSYTLTVTDNQGASSSSVISLVIRGTNDGPVADALVIDQVWQQGREFVLDVAQRFSDADHGETLSYTVSGLPRGLVYDTQTGLITGAATESGIFNVRITATDAQDASVSRSFGLTVTALVPETVTPAPVPPVPQPLPEGVPPAPIPGGPTGTGGSLDSGLVQATPVGNTAIDGVGFMSSGMPGDRAQVSSDIATVESSADGSNDVVLLSAPSATVTATTSVDGRPSVRASVDVSVGSDGVVSFDKAQQEAFSIVGLAVSAIDRPDSSSVLITIQDTNAATSLQDYSGSLGSGERLPAWISVDRNTGAISIGTPPAGVTEVVIRVQAVGSDGQIRVLELKLDLEELFRRPVTLDLESEVQAEPVPETGFMPLQGQFEAELQARNGYGDQLLKLLRSA